MDAETKRFWAEAAQRILGHEVTFAGPKGKATCHCAGASAAPGLRWCKAEWQRRQIRLCTGVGGECRIVRPSSLTETERGSIVTGPDEDSEVAKAGEAGVPGPADKDNRAASPPAPYQRAVTLRPISSSGSRSSFAGSRRVASSETSKLTRSLRASPSRQPTL